MNSTQAIEYIHSRLKFGINPGMERITALCAALDNPQDSLQFVHIAGTNGKGSTSTMIASALTAAGYKTGLFTSPYVMDFRERIQVDGEMISPADLANTVEQVKAACEKIEKDGIVPTEFETITAAAFLYFKNVACDVVVLEVGLGGLLDSTNIIKTPLVSVITSISTDHTAVLGDTIEEIAAQKSGIIKPDGVTVMYPEQEAGAQTVIFRTAAKNKNRLVVVDEAYVDFGAQTAVPLIQKYDNLIVVQTMSKSRQLAGARVGFAVACESLINDLKTIKFSFNPYNVNRLSTIAGAMAIKDHDYFDECCDKIKLSRKYLVDCLEKLGFFVLPSKANFVLAKHEKMSGQEVYAKLKQKGILVRHLGDERIKDFVRITVGTNEQIKQLAYTLSDIIFGEKV